jgi:putative ABC transport system permease protein
MVIACLGLFGLASFSVEERTKEIGIRKVLGASVVSVVGLLSKEFLKLVLLANLIAWPLAYYFMTGWLNNFAYRTDITGWVFLTAGGIALFVALATISAHSIKAATANPVKSLKYE